MTMSKDRLVTLLHHINYINASEDGTAWVGNIGPATLEQLYALGWIERTHGGNCEYVELSELGGIVLHGAKSMGAL